MVGHLYGSSPAGGFGATGFAGAGAGAGAGADADADADAGAGAGAGADAGACALPLVTLALSAANTDMLIVGAGELADPTFAGASCFGVAVLRT